MATKRKQPPEFLVARVRGEFSEMPGLRLTLEQACRLWQLEVSVCETSLGQLVREGFLYKTDSGFYIAAVTTRSRNLTNGRTDVRWGAKMSSANKKVIAVIGATGQQGGGVVRALKDGRRFSVRALSRYPEQHRGLADEVFEADLNRPDTLNAAFRSAHGVFLVTNFWAPGTDEVKEATAAVRAAKDAGVKHLIWSTLPNVEAISGGAFNVPHFTGKATVDQIVKDAGFAHHTFVVAPFYYENLFGALAPQKQADGFLGWALPLNPDVRCIHMGDIRELGDVVAGAFARPDQVGHGEYLPLVGDFMSFNEIVDTLNRMGHHFSFRQVPKESFATSFPGAAEIAETFSYFETYTYLGSDSSDRIALANRIAGRQPTMFSTWARLNLPVAAR
jgi:uncharacterized protein YbjT (DUF2867 family)